MENQSLSRIEPRDALLQVVETTRLENNPAAVYISSLAPGSRATMTQALNVIASLLGCSPVCSDRGKDMTLFSVPWGSLRFSHTAAIRSQLTETYSPPTCRKMLCALRGTLKAAWRLNLMGGDDYQRAIDVGGVRGNNVPKGRSLTLDELTKLFDACSIDETAAGRRDAALLAILRAGGLRRQEVCNLKLSDFDRSEEKLRVIGKGQKGRRVPLAPGATEAVMEWIKVRGTENGALFCPISRHGKVTIRRLSPKAIFVALRKRAAEAGIIENFSPHDLRRTLCGDLLDSGVDIATVAKILGHSSVETTQRYDRRGFAATREAVQKIDLPFKPRGAKLQVPSDIDSLACAHC